MLPDSVSLSLLVLGFSWASIWLWSQRRRQPFPPGPRSKDIDIQALRNQPWLTYTAWSKKYGPIVYYSLFGGKTIILNSAKTVSDLLESRSSIYSDRPKTWMAGVLANRKRNVFVISSLDPRFKIYRRLLQSGLNPRAARDYRPIQEKETNILLKSLSETPQDFAAHFRRNAVAVIIKVAYGYQVGGNDDLFVEIIEEGFKISTQLLTPGKFMVEAFPILRFVPAWFPGAGWKRYAIEMGEKMSRVDVVPFNWAKQQIGTGDYVESFTSKQLRSDARYLENEDKEDVVKWCSAALYAGGADTTVSALITFIFLMEQYPEIQKKAQEDIDRVSPGRLPTFDDYESLPYNVAIIKETIRWGPVAPLGLPHRLVEDDVYDGYFIPKGTRVVSNIWAITHDENLYPNPSIFDPSRHLGEHPQADPFKYVFGFGRRVCPGAHLAEMSLFLTTTNILASFNISKLKNPDGTDIEPPMSWSTGITSHLQSFPCDIAPRSKNLLAMLA